MKTKIIRKVICSLLAVLLVIGLLPHENLAFADEEMSQLNEEQINVVENNRSEVTLEKDVETPNGNGVVSATYNKDKKQFFVTSKETDSNGNVIKEDNYKVLMEKGTSEEVIAKLVDTKTGKTYDVNTNEFNASLLWFIPIVVVIGESLLSHLLAIGAALVIAGVTYTAVKQIADQLKRRNYDHYAAIITRGDLYIGNPLDYSSAVQRMRSSNNVWSKSYALAAKVARGAGSNRTPIGPERDKGKSAAEGYYFHFHTYNRSGGHSFYY